LKILVIGDFHIPSRAQSIPDKIFETICKMEINLILCTGDLTDGKILDKLREIAPLKWVVGNTDYIRGNTSEIIKIDEYDIGLIHGTEIYPRGDVNQLYEVAKKMHVDILISGHTHAMSVHNMYGRILVNPGSATGAWGGGPATFKPSFIVLEISKELLDIWCYELVNNKLVKTVKRFRKNGKSIMEST